MNKLAYHLWSLSRDENLLRNGCFVCVSLAVLSYLSAGLNQVPDRATPDNEKMWISADGRMLGPRR